MRFSGPALLLALAAGVRAQQFDNFGQTCSGIQLVGSGATQQLQATCRNTSGGDNGAQVIALSTCLTNINGQLRCQFNGNALASCTGCSLSGTSLTCSCAENGTGQSDRTTIDLNTCIGNENGRMFC